MPESAEVVLDDPDLLGEFEKHVRAAQEGPIGGTLSSARTVVGIFETDDGQTFQGLVMTQPDASLGRGLFMMFGGATGKGPLGAQGRPSRQTLWLKQAPFAPWHERLARTWPRPSGEDAPTVARSAEQLAVAPETTTALRCDGLAADDILAALPRLPRVRDLELICSVYDASPAPGLFQRVATLPRLERLWVRGPWCGDPELAALCFGKLHTLALDYTAVSAKGVAQLASLPSLRRLELWGRLDASLLSQLQKLKQLDQLHVHGATGTRPGVLAAELARLKKALPDCRVVYRPDTRKPPARIPAKK